MSDIITIIVSVVLAAGGFIWRSIASSKLKGIEKPTKKQKRGRKYATWLIILGLYVLVTRVIEMIFGKQESKMIEVSIATERVHFLGLDISTTILFTWCIMAILIIAAIILRLTLVPRLKDIPSGSQNVIEIAIESVIKYTKTSSHELGEFMASYLFTIALFLVSCAFTELFGLRTPASDITLTAALAIITFFFINFYGIKKHGLGGRLKSLASPTPVVFPIRILTDLAVPVSMASRLFGNMLGGLVVMDLLYMALGGYAVGIPSVAGLYFNVFHPLIQAFIFVTLTLTFINEATE